ncbi:MAG: hypothetical protein PQJ44_01325, partial [Sphaerochaetaceae bacterium]|nr:hypothetical protein [Sphaerochaetaceae bacterium]
MGLKYDKKYLPENPDNSVHLPKNYEQQFLVDTTAIKNRIKENTYEPEDVLKEHDPKRYNIIQKDKNYLAKLRRMYNNNDTISVNEFDTYKDRKLFGTGKTELTPFNVLQNFKLYKGKDNKVHYEDDYDFNKF